MSRHVLKPVNPDHDFVVGWNPFLNTFFAQVIDVTKDMDDPLRDVVSMGCKPGEILFISVVLWTVYNYAISTERERVHLHNTLVEDKERNL